MHCDLEAKFPPLIWFAWLCMICVCITHIDNICIKLLTQWARLLLTWLVVLVNVIIAQSSTSTRTMDRRPPSTPLHTLLHGRTCRIIRVPTTSRELVSVRLQFIEFTQIRPACCLFASRSMTAGSRLTRASVCRCSCFHTCITTIECEKCCCLLFYRQFQMFLFLWSCKSTVFFSRICCWCGVLLF